MKMKYAVLGIMLAGTVAAEAKDVMVVRMNDGSESKYDVEAVDEIVFDESAEPVVPPTPAERVRPTAIGPWEFHYDSDGRCVLIVDNADEITFGFDYAKGVFSVMDYPVGTFKVNEHGFLTELNIDFIGSSHEKVTYDEEGHIIRVQSESYDGDEHLVADDNFVWKDGLLLELNISEESSYDGHWEDQLVFTYSDIANPLGQCTIGMGDMEDVPFCAAGLQGIAPVKFPTSSKWSTDMVKEISYTFNDNGTINTEKVGSTTFDYHYAASGKAPRSHDVISLIVRTLRSRR